jgi:hypothetical protein
MSKSDLVKFAKLEIAYRKKRWAKSNVKRTAKQSQYPLALRQMGIEGLRGLVASL